VFGPAAAANFRSNLLRSGNLPDRVLKRIDTPTLLLSSAKDRMLPSLAEGELQSFTAT
jgi:pimeloyl-ACP methyl ester carboxylesterase